MFSTTGLVRSGTSLGAPASLPIAIGVAILAGWLMDLGFPDRDWWPLTLLGTAAMMFAVKGLSVPKALLVGAVGGFTFYGITIWWLTVYLGLVPWIALTLTEVLIFSLGMGLIALIWRYGSQHWSSVAGRLGVLPALVGGAWMLREAISSTYPWGGFAWARLAQSQSESTLAPLVSWFGTSGMSFVLAWAVALGVALMLPPPFLFPFLFFLSSSFLLSLFFFPSFPFY